jgi:hypothetical protein
MSGRIGTSKNEVKADRIQNESLIRIRDLQHMSKQHEVMVLKLLKKISKLKD